MKRARVVYDGTIHTGYPHLNGVQLEDGRILAESDVVWLPPIEPHTIFAIGLNYADRAVELDFKPPQKPLVFLKGPNALIGHRATSRCPSDVRQMHFECELAVVIGRGGRGISRDAAMSHIAGYTVANDYAIREYLENYYRPNLRVKNRDGCTPTGPWLVDTADIADPHALELRTFVNGELVVRGNTRDMIFTIPDLVVFLSEFMTLASGDIIMTGTPKGARYLRPGDEVVTEIESVGRLVNTIAGDKAFGIGSSERS